MPKLVRLLALHAGLGFALGVAFAATLVLADVGGLKQLLDASPDRLLALGALETLCGLTFASLVMGWAVMTLPYGEPDD